ncbi:MAG: tetratricopeptide repeat protein [Bacteroidota bacterium]
MQLTLKIHCWILIGWAILGFSTKAVADSGEFKTNYLNGSSKKSPIQAYLDLGTSYREQSDYPKAIEAFEQGLRLSQKANDLTWIVRYHRNLGEVYKKSNEYTHALDHFQIILDKFSNGQLKDQQIIAQVYFEMASIYNSLGNYELAYQNQIQSLNHNEMLQDSMGIARNLYGIGSIFFYQESYERALDYYDRSLGISKKLVDTRMVYSSLAAIGSTYNRMGNTELSVQYNFNSLKVAKDMNYKMGVCYATQNIGSDYLEMGQTTLAIDYLKQAVETRQEIEDKWGLCSTYRMLATAYTANQDYDKALEFGHKSLELAQIINSNTRKIEIYKVLANVYRESGKSDKAFNYLYKHMMMKDSSINESSIQKMSDIKKSYEIQKREKEIALIKKNQQLNRWQKNTFIGAFILSLCIMWMIYSRYRTQFANNKILEEKNVLIQKQNEQLEIANQRQVEMNQKLEDSNKELEQFAYVASHDLKEPLRTINSYTSLLQRRFLPKVSDPTANEFMNFIMDGTQRMQNLLDELLNYSRAIRSSQNLEMVNTSEIAEMVTFNLNRLIQEKNAQVDIGHLPVIKANKTQINQLFQNLISNAVKYTHQDNPQVTVQCKEKDQQYVFSIKDNGIGIAPEHKEEIFQMFRRLHTNKEFEGTGIGLATCKKIVSQYGGNIWVESVKNEGSTFFFSIPGKLAVN